MSGLPMKAKHPEAQALLAETAEDRREIKRLMARIGKRQKRLEAVVIEEFNKVSEPIDGIVLDPGEVTIGYRPCTESPIGVCCYSDAAMTIPGQRMYAKWRAEQGHNYFPSSPGADTDACLFCGQKL